ncbi:alpha/beta fold hydrolase [Marinobacter halodurans]|uniref:alpha/beta fold hydrolase n=1 Tax=Marinobacter halodurans TaxID=2528979 RepID=UPI001F625245|nr:alpha/beta hydrolase [Marinobacter halodurans]
MPELTRVVVESTDARSTARLRTSCSAGPEPALNSTRKTTINRFRQFRSHDGRLTLRDGRDLVFTDLGDPQGAPVLFAHGMPGCRMEGWFFHRQARHHGFRVITPDRPGIGGSTFQPKRVLLDYPGDVAQLADALGIDRFIHMGWSSGGSRTLACAYAMPERVRLAVSLSGYTNFAEYEGRKVLLEATRWPGPMLARISPTLLRLVVRIVMRLSRRHPGLYLREARQLVSVEDRALLSSFMHTQLFRADQITCLESGGRAIAEDLMTELVDWGFRLHEVTVPTLIYQGREDPFVPVAYARHLADNLPNAEVQLLPEAGHLYPLSEAFQGDLFERLRGRVKGG